jgi:hypothetical protein
MFLIATNIINIVCYGEHKVDSIKQGAHGWKEIQ